VKQEDFHLILIILKVSITLFKKKVEIWQIISILNVKIFELTIVHRVKKKNLNEECIGMFTKTILVRMISYGL